MVGSYNRGYVKRATGGGTSALTVFVPVVDESKFLSLDWQVSTRFCNSFRGKTT